MPTAEKLGLLKGGKQRRYWSAIKNLQNRINKNDVEGKAARHEYYVRTRDKKFNEVNFKKRFSAGKVYSLLEIRKAFLQVKKLREKHLRKDWLESKKAGNKATFKEFKEANEEPDWDAIQELFNSPK